MLRSGGRKVPADQVSLLLPHGPLAPSFFSVYQVRWLQQQLSLHEARQAASPPDQLLHLVDLDPIRHVLRIRGGRRTARTAQAACPPLASGPVSTVWPCWPVILPSALPTKTATTTPPTPATNWPRNTGRPIPRDAAGPDCLLRRRAHGEWLAEHSAEPHRPSVPLFLFLLTGPVIEASALGSRSNLHLSGVVWLGGALLLETACGRGEVALFVARLTS